MSRLNKEWHEMNKMPKNASDEQRINWHLEHSRNCTCRPIPSGVIELMKKKGIEVPKDQNNI